MSSEIIAELEQWFNEENELNETNEGECFSDVDLYSFYEQLCVFKNEFSKITRKNADTLGRIDTEMFKVFEKLLQSQSALELKFEQLSRTIASEKDHKKKFLALTEIFDRLNRINKGFKDTPKDSIWVKKSAWKDAWENLHAGYKICFGHLEEFLSKEGFQVTSSLGLKFDPHTMVAVNIVCLKDENEGLVVEVLSEGFLYKGEIFKLAQVTVNKKGE